MAVDVATLRRYVVATQRFGRDEPLEAAIRRLSAVQIDPLAVVERSHRVVLGSRVGPYDEAELSLLLASGRVFEYWAHELCFLPVDAYPLVRWRFREGARWRNYDEALRRWAEVADSWSSGSSRKARSRRARSRATASTVLLSTRGRASSLPPSCSRRSSTAACS